MTALYARELDTSHSAHMRDSIAQLLGPHRDTAVVLGDNCVAIDTYDDAVTEVLTDITPALTSTPALVIGENSGLIFRFGNDTATSTTTTTDYHLAWASINGIPQWLNHITSNAEYMAQKNIGTLPYDFLVIQSTTADQTYIQCYYNPHEANYHVEKRLGSPDQHYQRTTDTLNETANLFHTWMTSSQHDTTGWQPFDIT